MVWVVLLSRDNTVGTAVPLMVQQIFSSQSQVDPGAAIGTYIWALQAFVAGSFDADQAESPSVYLCLAVLGLVLSLLVVSTDVAVGVV